MKKLNAAVIGVGNMGKHHARIYSEINGTELISICDKDIRKGIELSKKYNCLFYKDYREMIEKNEIKIVSVALPTFLHYEVTKFLMERKVNVLIEKPITENISTANELLNLSKAYKIKLMVGHIERYNPAIIRLNELIKSGILGKIVSINIKRIGGLPPQVKDANVILDLAIHDIDISNYILMKFPKKYYSFKSKNFLKDREDNVHIILDYGKTISSIEASWITPVKIRSMEITGTEGYLILDYINQNIFLYKNVYFNKNLNFENFDDFISKYNLTDEIKIGVEIKEPLRCEIERFIEVINCDLDNTEELFYNLKALEIALSI